jgi:hypothetical protein
MSQTVGMAASQLSASARQGATGLENCATPIVPRGWRLPAALTYIAMDRVTVRPPLLDSFRSVPTSAVSVGPAATTRSLAISIAGNAIAGPRATSQMCTTAKSTSEGASAFGAPPALLKKDSFATITALRVGTTAVSSASEIVLLSTLCLAMEVLLSQDALLLEKAVLTSDNSSRLGQCVMHLFPSYLH